jgi:hypothetical protein
LLEPRQLAHFRHDRKPESAVANRCPARFIRYRIERQLAVAKKRGE